MSFYRKNGLNNLQEEKVRYILPRNDGEISSSITKNWTDQAIRCYRGNCNCQECSIAQGNYSFVCQMPNVVKILLDQTGPPDQERIEKLLA
jgi:hypothetical protein